MACRRRSAREIAQHRLGLGDELPQHAVEQARRHAFGKVRAGAETREAVDADQAGAAGRRLAQQAQRAQRMADGDHRAGDFRQAGAPK